MSLESLVELVLSEAKAKADALLADAAAKAEALADDAQQQAQIEKQQILEGYAKQVSRIELQTKAIVQMAEKTAKLSAINEALEKLAEEIAKSIASSREGQEKILSWVASKKERSFEVGKDLLDAFPSLAKNISECGSLKTLPFGYTINAITDKYIDVLDLKELGRRCISDNASDIVAKLSSP